MQRVHVVQDFPRPVEEVFAYLSEHEHLEPLFGAKVRRLTDGTDGTRNGVGSRRELKVGPLPPFVETIVEVVPNELIRYLITEGGVLRNHQGVMRFSSTPTGCRVDYTIEFGGKIPGTAPLIRKGLQRNVAQGLAEYAAG
jgi:uncharacterized protein YndB with AHSA1/START domain